ncbi:hypothetical protein Q1695_011729 [Nippostrongylus brasiliensis]|nr:hypothetical protein Q1695_011729 [Nippostrongylus brasiliensis]
MILLVSVLLTYFRLSCSKYVVNFHAASEYGVIDDSRTVAENRLLPTKTSAVDEEVALNVPHPIGADTLAESWDRQKQSSTTASSAVDVALGETPGRKLPILRVDADSRKSLAQPVPEVVKDSRQGPEQSTLVEDESNPGLRVDHAEAPTQKEGNAFRNALPHVDAVPTVGTTTDSPAKEEKKQPEKYLFGESPVEKAETGKENTLVESGHVEEYLETTADVLPSAKAMQLEEKMPKIIKSLSIDGISNGSAAFAVEEKEVRPVSTQQTPSDLKSAEDDDADSFSDFDEKSDGDLEFHEDVDVAKVPADWTSSTPSPATFAPDFLAIDTMTEEEIYDLLMYLITLLPKAEEPSMWSKIIAGLQCALRDCRRAFPRLTTVATPIGNGTFIIRRARSKCQCMMP